MRKILFAVAAGIALAMSAAVPAFAAGTPVTATVSVASSVSLSGVTSTITFPEGTPGGSVTATNAEDYTVTTNDAAGATMEWEEPSDGMLDYTTQGAGIPGIPVTDVSILESSGNTYTFSSSGSPLVVGTVVPGTSSGTFRETWNLNLPDSAMGGSYSGTFTALAIGN